MYKPHENDIKENIYACNVPNCICKNNRYKCKHTFKFNNGLALNHLYCTMYSRYHWIDVSLYASGDTWAWVMDTLRWTIHSTLKIILQYPIVALNKAVGNVSLDCTCFLLPCIFIKNPDATAGAPPFHNVRKDCKGKHMWPTSSHQTK